MGSLSATLERIETEVKPLGRLLDKAETLTEAVQSHAKDMSRQAKFQAAILALAALAFLMLLTKLILRS